MERQMSFAEAEFAGKKRKTRREQFLAEMDKVIPWQRLIGRIAPHYPKGERGRPPIGIERMLRIYFLQQWYGLADELLEETIYDNRPANTSLYREKGPYLDGISCTRNNTG